MNEQEPFRMSYGLEVLPPKPGQAYPVTCDEWDFIKSGITAATSEPWLFRTIGTLLLGAGITTSVSILLGNYSRPEQQNTFVAASAVAAVMLICGGLSVAFGERERKNHRGRAGNALTQMNLIEARFERKGGAASANAATERKAVFRAT